MSNPVYGNTTKSTNSSKPKKQRSMLEWLLVGGLVLFLIWAPFQIALFNGQMLNFEKPLYWAVLISSLLMFLWIANYYREIKLETQRDWLLVAVLLLPLTYVLSLISAASEYLAMNMVLIQCIYAVIFAIAVFILQNKQINHIIHLGILGISYVIVGFGLLNWLGASHLAANLVGWFTGAVQNGIYVDAVMVDSNGPRLTSVFQYANTYAAFLMALLFASIFSLVKSKKWIGQLTHGFMLVPIIISLLLTLSRTGLVLLPVVFVVLLLFLKPAKQILWIIYCLIAGGATIAVLNPITTIGLQLHEQYSASAALDGWIYLLVASIITAVLAWSIQKYLAPRLTNGVQRWADRKYSNLWIPVGSSVIAGIMGGLLLGTGLKSILPQSIQIRLENINFNQHSVLERFTFYKDAMKLLGDYPIVGAGGGAWASLYETYQNNPYTSRQAHNFFMQYLVEVGIIGFIIFMSFMIFIIYKYVKGYIRSSEENRESHFLYFIITFSILTHSILDFNMSYVFMGILVFLGFGGMAAVMDNKPVKKLRFTGNGSRYAYLGVVGVLSIIVLFTSVRYLQSSYAAVEAQQVAQNSQSFEEIKTALDKDLSTRKTHPDSLLLMAEIYQQVYVQTQDEQFYNEGMAWLERGLAAEPFNKKMLRQQISLYQAKGENEKAFAIQNERAKNFNWDITWYETLISQAHDIGYQALGNQDNEKKEEYFKAGLAAYEHVKEGIEHLKTLPEGQLQGRAFEITPSIALSAGKIEFMQNQPAEAAATLKQGLKEDMNDPTNQEIARWYLASLKKTGQTDEQIMNQLVAVQPEAQQQVEQLANVNF
ncbi:O-antigen ligase family protein [Paenibacillus sp. Marseille-Q4541]|uniref:O-antigen ligase family protein n=1 Tax=Paenibacillus sp. Marseille-Q4541 TaxID=2831522 RepID=UPI001BAAEFF6|nr:O-antigen ligase family protein [Paenibacillus sp. Marseille-Q4541]